MTFVLSTSWIKEGKTERLKDWYRELDSRKDEALQTLDNEGIRQEVAFVLNTEHGDMLAVFMEVEDLEAAYAAFTASPFKIDHEHAAVMKEVTAAGVHGTTFAELMYAFQNPRKDAVE